MTALVRVILCIALPALVIPALGCTERTPTRRPNVLLYVVDALRADALNSTGDPMALTPRLDEFVGDAMVFENAYAPSSWTRTSMASLLTGTLPSRHGTESRTDTLANALPTLAELLQGAGYRTGFITTNPNVGSFFGFKRGFEDMLELYSRRTRGFIKASEIITKSDTVTEQAIQWVDSASQPFFLTILTVDPHVPYSAPAAYVEAVRPESEPSGFERIRFLYRAEVALNDHSFGKLIDHLRETHLLDETIVIFTSDHGEEFGEHQGLQHGKTLYEEVLRIPLIIRYPRSRRVAAGTRVARPVQIVDILPTILELADLDRPGALDGVSLLDPSPPESRPSFARLRLGEYQLDSVRHGPWKLIRQVDTGEERMYHLDRDPAERDPLTAPLPEAARVAREHLVAALERVPRAEAPPTRALSEMPEDARKALEALGYLETSPSRGDQVRDSER
jgi:arylsulfatase A-like enzyme